MRTHILSSISFLVLLTTGCSLEPDRASITGPGAPLTHEDGLEPPPSTAPEVFEMISAGFNHTCGLAGGAAYCWGGIPLEGPRPVPTPVGDGPTFSSIYAGDTYTCGLDEAGGAYCWGSNGGGRVVGGFSSQSGRLGDGSTADRELPTPVIGGHVFSSLAVHRAHTCGLTTNGSAYCWGSNEFGQLGDGTTTDRHAPTPVSGDHVFVALDVGGFHTCGLEADGDAFCWGRSRGTNAGGALGDGTESDRHVPTMVSGGHAFASIRLGLSHTCAVDLDGVGYCWGENDAQGLGDGTKENHLVPAPVSGGIAFALIEPGDLFTCALDVEGKAYCWGPGEFGALGTGSVEDVLVPTSVSGDLTLASISAGTFHVCGLDPAGGAYCWGYNRHYEIGDGTTTDRMVPTPVQSTAAPTGHIRAERVADLKVESATSSSLTVYWTEVDDGLGRPAWYRLKYAESPLENWKTATIGCHRSIRGEEVGAELWCTVKDLTPGTTYDLQLMSHRVENGVWQGAVYSNMAAGTTLNADVATAVDDLEVTEATSSTLTLRWTQVDDGRGEPAWYRVRYGSPMAEWKSGMIGCQRNLVGTEIGAEMSCTIEGLDAGSAYDVQLYSYYYRNGKWAAAHPSNRTSGTTTGP